MEIFTWIKGNKHYILNVSGRVIKTYEYDSCGNELDSDNCLEERI